MPRPSFPRAPGPRSKTLLKFALPILAVATLTACSLARDAFRVDNAFYFEDELQEPETTDLDYAAEKAERQAINLDEFHFPDLKDGETAYVEAIRAPGPMKAEMRNRLLAYLSLHRAINPDYSFAEKRKFLPYKNPTDLERFAEGLRKAGLKA